MIEIPELRNQIAQIINSATRARAEFRGGTTNFPLVSSTVLAPLGEVRQKISEEIARRQSSEAMVPIDRDPVPPKFSEVVRTYYEQLGTSK